MQSHTPIVSMNLQFKIKMQIAESSKHPLELGCVSDHACLYIYTGVMQNLMGTGLVNITLDTFLVVTVNFLFY